MAGASCVRSFPHRSLRAQRGNLVMATGSLSATGSPRRCAPRDDKLGTRERGTRIEQRLRTASPWARSWVLLPVLFRDPSSSHRREFIGQLGHIEKIQTSNRLPFTEKCRNSHARLWTDRWRLPTLIIAIAAGRSHTATATAYDAEVAADDETGKQLEPLPGLPMQRLWRDHTCGRRAKRFHHVGVSLRQVSNFSAKARNGHQRRPFCSDWNSGTPPGMMATVTSVTTPATVTPGRP